MAGFLKSLFSKSENTVRPTKDEQAVIIHLKLSNEEFGYSGETAEYYPLEDDIEALVENNGVGELDGHEFGGGFAVFYLYGPDAEKLYSAISDRILSIEALSGSFVVKRYGQPGSHDIQQNKSTRRPAFDHWSWPLARIARRWRSPEVAIH